MKLGLKIIKILMNNWTIEKNVNMECFLLKLRGQGSTERFVLTQVVMYRIKVAELLMLFKMIYERVFWAKHYQN